jgi:hypothetical protein
MKKSAIVLMMCLAAGLCFTSCTKKEKELIVKPATIADDWDSWAFTWNEAHTQCTTVNRNNGERVWNLDYSTANTVKITGYSTMTITLGSNGYASKYADEWGDTFEYTYDAEGHMTKVTRSGEVRSNIVWTGGNMTSWSKFDTNDSGATVEYKKTHTYSTVANLAGIYEVYCEKAGAPRWLFETGLFGKPNAYLCATNKWDYSETTSNLSYTFDSYNCPLKMTKTYGEDTENFSWTYNYIQVPDAK